MASTMVWLSAYLPVPTINRERNVRPPIVSGESVCAVTVVVMGLS